MSNRIKSINLDEVTEPIAMSIMSNGGNLSKFVRECLIRYHAETEGSLQCTRSLRGNDRLCRPFKKNRCIVCWPSGPPSSEDWSEYVAGPSKFEKRRHKHTNMPDNPTGTASFLVDPEHPLFPGWYTEGEVYEVCTFQESEKFNDHSWIQERATSENPPLFDLSDMDTKGNAKPKTPRRRRRRLIRWLFG